MAGLMGLDAGPSVPSGELDRVAQAKARASWFLEWWVLRQAGFTEQRELPALCSGRITGCSGWANCRLNAGPPVPSGELDLVAQAKVWASRFLKWWVLRRGWIHRAARTTRSLQWKDNGLLFA
ncbi:hypothetical protein STAS_27922 [Striga asiatica]|uniref:Uncharacterized protein n=1 Tax=Striga asiatica TaxID=4170 RepID=A0A5A7QZR4_STRAF|nr:hypothetical protein STAS_27922 [Striga asiatica]